jgi:hypothetical protein
MNLKDDLRGPDLTRFKGARCDEVMIMKLHKMKLAGLTKPGARERHSSQVQ